MGLFFTINYLKKASLHVGPEKINFDTNDHSMASVLDKELSSYLKQLNEREKKSVLLMLKAFLQGRSAEGQRISIEDYNREIDEAMAEVERGEVYTHKQVVEMSKHW
jgi:predicted transcriptional regulator